MKDEGGDVVPQTLRDAELHKFLFAFIHNEGEGPLWGDNQPKEVLAKFDKKRDCFTSFAMTKSRLIVIAWSEGTRQSTLFKQKNEFCKLLKRVSK